MEGFSFFTFAGLLIYVVGYTRDHNYDCLKEPKDHHVNVRLKKTHLHKESINFTSLGVICGKKER